ncbi:MAG TPA: carboxypeptidase regulatory-like domain-containing protein [Hyalangium sp.]|nr:carboxypeptidase regulatory-like domain-containing protein [Hyalangium sp.]
MRQTLHIAMGALLTLGSLGCGELENAPFLIGTVHGRLTESDPGTALVSVMNAPELRAPVEPDGSFVLEEVPAGAAELFIIASASKTLRVPLIVQGGQSISVGLLTPKEASFLSVRVKAPSHQPVEGGQVSLVGTPVEPLRPDEDGRLLIGPLPDGCYTLNVSLAGFREVLSDTCVSAGERKKVKVNLPAPSSGCMETGCSGDFLCMPSGQCVECTEDSHCGPGFSCRGLRCEGEGKACTSCEGDWKCKSGTSCQELPDGAMACVESCRGTNECEDGFVCQAGRCLPDSAQYTGCKAYRQVGAACGGDAECRGMGLVNGLCVEGICTLRCSMGDECPSDFSCEQAAMGGRVCVYRP